MPETIWVAVLRISDRTARKIIADHGLYPAEVRDAVVCRPRLRFAWDHDPERGLRALVKVSIRERERLVVLYPTEDPMGDVWNLGSAYSI